MKLIYKKLLFWLGMVVWFYLMFWELSFDAPDNHIPMRWYWIPNFFVSLIFIPNALAIIVFGWDSFKKGWEKFLDDI